MQYVEMDSSVRDDDDDEIDEDDGPPASLVLDTHDQQEALNKSPLLPITQSNRVHESLRLSRMGGTGPSNQRSDERLEEGGESDGLEDGLDEEAGRETYTMSPFYDRQRGRGTHPCLAEARVDLQYIGR